MATTTARKGTAANPVIKYRNRTVPAKKAPVKRRRPARMGAGFTKAGLMAGIKAYGKGAIGGAGAILLGNAIPTTSEAGEVGVNIGAGLAMSVLLKDTHYAAGAGGAIAGKLMGMVGLADGMEFLADGAPVRMYRPGVNANQSRPGLASGYPSYGGAATRTAPRRKYM